MPHYRALLVLLIAPALACTMWNKPPSGWKGATGGEQIEKLFWKDVQSKNWTEVDRHVAGIFAATGPSGTMDRAAFLQDLQNTPLTEFSLSDCQSQSNGADVIVACTLHAQWAGQPAASTTLSVWQPLKKGWVMVAHSESRRAGS